MGSPPTQQKSVHTIDQQKQQFIPHSPRIVCRCCLSEEDEMTDYLSLDAIATINIRDICNGFDDGDSVVVYNSDGVGNDDSGQHDAAVSDSSSSTNSSTLLDCLNGCARIGATLEDATLPLHICLDCSQALEACCEFIRCVRNADKILRRKESKRSAAMLPKEGTPQTAEKVVDLKSTFAEKTVSQTETVRCFGEQQGQLIIGTLSLQDLIEDADLRDLDLDKATLIHNQNDVEQSSQANIANSDAQLSVYTPHGMGVSYINFDFTQDNRLLDITLAQCNRETANLSDQNKNDDCTSNYMNTKTTSMTPNSKDCNESLAYAEVNSNISAKEQHKFIPPLLRDNTHYELVDKNASIFTKDELHKSIKTLAYIEDVGKNISINVYNNSNPHSENIPINNYKATQFTILTLDGRKYVVNAAIANDLKKFHKDNKGNLSYLCKFCIFMCVSQKGLEDHLMKHLGPPCYSCSECNFRCRFKYYLKKHMRKIHSSMEAKLHYDDDGHQLTLTQHCAKKFYCSICRCYFSSFIGLQQHYHNDEKPCFRCTHCGKGATEREELMEHLAAEHKIFIDSHLIASYIPSVTQIAEPLKNQPSFSSSANSDVDKIFLSQFIKLHSKEPKVISHVCKFCGRNFKRRFHLLRHEQLSHPKDNKKENYTLLKHHSSKFVRKQYTRQLLRATQAEHQFKCEPCRHVFKTHVDLVAHMQTHGNAKFECETCRAVFTFEFELKYHLRTHSSPSSSTSPRSEYFAPVSNLGLNNALQSRLLQLKQQKIMSPRKRLGLDNFGSNRRTISKRRLSLASVSTAKSSEEGSVNSPSNANSDEEMPPASLISSSSIDYEYRDYEIDNTPKSVADVMLPQTLQRNVIRRLSSISSANVGSRNFCSSSPLECEDSTTQVQNSSTITVNDKQLNTGEANDQIYLNDFDLNLLDYSNDFWLQLSSF